MDRKTGWARTAFLERLYLVSGTFEKAKILFDKYYIKVYIDQIEAFDQQKHPLEIQFGTIAILHIRGDDCEESVKYRDGASFQNNAATLKAC